MSAATCEHERPQVLAAVETQAVARLPGYRPRARIAATISLWRQDGFERDTLKPLVHAWSAGLQDFQPDICLEERRHGNVLAIDAFQAAPRTVVILGDELSAADATAFRCAKGYAPTAIQVANGHAHKVFVHRDNPLAGLSLRQLDAVFVAGLRSDARGRASVWGDLGLAGEWKQARIQPYGLDVDENFQRFIREALLEDDLRWNQALREFGRHTGPHVLDALARDRFGIAICPLPRANEQVRQLALARHAGQRFVVATPETIVSQEFPLTRTVAAFVDKPPGGRIHPAVRELLRYMLSREGQMALTGCAGVLPLGERQIAAQLEQVD